MRKKLRNKSERINKKELTNNMLAIFSAHPKRAFNYKQISGELLITDSSEKRMITELLYELKEKDTLEEVTTGKFRLKERGGTVIGTVDMARGGYGYVVSENFKEDVFVSQNNLNHALNGDTVKVLVYAHKKSRNLEGEVVEIIERARETFVGIIDITDKFAFLVPDSRQMPFDLYIPLDKLKGAKKGQKAIARLTEWPRNVKNPFGEVIEVLGNQGENDT
jgi:ribonuclease R